MMKMKVFLGLALVFGKISLGVAAFQGWDPTNPYGTPVRSSYGPFIAPVVREYYNPISSAMPHTQAVRPDYVITPIVTPVAPEAFTPFVPRHRVLVSQLASVSCAQAEPPRLSHDGPLQPLPFPSVSHDFEGEASPLADIPEDLRGLEESDLLFLSERSSSSSASQSSTQVVAQSSSVSSAVTQHPTSAVYKRATSLEEEDLGNPLAKKKSKMVRKIETYDLKIIKYLVEIMEEGPQKGEFQKAFEVLNSHYNFLKSFQAKEFHDPFLQGLQRKSSNSKGAFWTWMQNYLEDTQAKVKVVSLVNEMEDGLDKTELKNFIKMLSYPFVNIGWFKEHPSKSQIVQEVIKSVETQKVQANILKRKVCMLLLKKLDPAAASAFISLLE